MRAAGSCQRVGHSIVLQTSPPKTRSDSAASKSMVPPCVGQEAQVQALQATLAAGTNCQLHDPWLRPQKANLTHLHPHLPLPHLPIATTSSCASSASSVAFSRRRHFPHHHHPTSSSHSARRTRHDAFRNPHLQPEGREPDIPRLPQRLPTAARRCLPDPGH